MATVEAIAQLAGEAGSVYDRGLSLYLSDHGLEPERAVSLARDELAIRPDVYGYDTLAWALLNAGDAAGADAPMQSALAAGTKDARLWYHAGLIALANWDVPPRPPPTSSARSPSGRRWTRCPRARGGRRPGDDPMRRARSAPRSRALSWRSCSSRSSRRSPWRTRWATSRSTTTRASASSPTRVLLDVVIDEAEIPTFQASQGFDSTATGRCRRPRRRPRAPRPA